MTVAAPALALTTGIHPSGRHLALVAPGPYEPRIPPLLLGGDATHQDTLPGECWPALAVTQFQQPGRPVIGWWEIGKTEAVRLLIEWHHKLHLKGQDYQRPYGSMYFRMDVLGRPAAVVVLASSPNPSVSKDHGLYRYNCVDLARICRSPDRRDESCLRAVLRLSREYLVPLYPLRYPKKWSVVEAAIANSLPGTPSSELEPKSSIYRFDGWERLRLTKAKKASTGKRGKPSKAAELDDGLVGLWAYRYPTPRQPGRPPLKLVT